MKIFTVLFFLISSVVQAQVSMQQCSFDIECPGDFKLEVKSLSGECIEDDSTITFKRGELSTKMEIAPQYFYEIPNVGNISSACKTKNFASYPIFISKGKALMFLRHDGRPSWSHIVAVYFDTANGKVIDQVNLGRYTRNTFGVLKTKRGYKVQLQHTWIKEMNCDCDAAVSEKWMEVSIVKNKIVKRWL